MKKKTFIPIIVIALLVIAGGYKLMSNKSELDEKAQETEVIINEIPVNTAKVMLQSIEDKLDLVGTFQARKELTVIAESQGRITNIRVVEGQKISKGQTIATIDDATMRSQLATAQASLAKAEKDVERYANLLKVGAISQTQFEDVNLSMQNQQTNVTSIQQQLRYATVTSPMNGVVKEIILEEGSFANPGTQIASIVDIDNLKMIVTVDEMDIVKVTDGQKVNIVTEVYPDVTFEGVVNQIGVQADKARKYEISIEVKNPKATPLKAGMYGQAIIPSSLQGEKDVMTIPRKSVEGSLKNPQVYVVQNGTAKLTNITIGKTLGDAVVVTSGLDADSEVITTGQINLQDGKKIRVIL